MQAAGDAVDAVSVERAANLVEINLATTEGDDRIGRARQLVVAANAAAKRATAFGP